MSSAVDQIRTAVEQLRLVGRAEGIEVDGPLGQWLEAQADALRVLADVLDGQDQRVGDLLFRIEGAANAQVVILQEAIQGANHVVKQGEFVLRQARTAQMGVVVERDHLVQKMVKETLPLFAEKMKAALVIKEEGWNAKARDNRLGIAAAIVLAVFTCGYMLSWWQDSGQVAAFNRCLAHPVQFDQQLFCPAAGLLSAPTVTGNSGGS